MNPLLASQKSLNTLLGLLKETFCQWRADNASRLGAGLAFYSLFSIAPLLVILVSIAGLLFGSGAAPGRVAAQLQGLVGREAAHSIEGIIGTARAPAPSAIALAAGLVALMFGASGVFRELQEALNAIWNVPPPRHERTIRQLIKDRFLSFTMVIFTGFLLLASLVMSAALATLNASLGRVLVINPVALEAVHAIISFAVTALLFAVIFKRLPDVIIAWSDVWIGASVTALLFTIGKVLIGWYLGKSNVPSSYGAAGSVVFLLLWVYYSTQILFLGAEFTQVYANRYGSHLSFAEQEPQSRVG